MDLDIAILKGHKAFEDAMRRFDNRDPFRVENSSTYYEKQAVRSAIEAAIKELKQTPGFNHG